MKSSDCMSQLSVNRCLITDLHDKQNYQRSMTKFAYEEGKVGAAKWYEKDADRIGRQIARLARLQRVLKDTISDSTWSRYEGWDG